MVIGREEVLPIELLEKHTERGEWTLFRFPLCSLWVLIPSAAAAKSLQSCPTLCDPIDGSPPGSSVHGVFQARVLERVAISFSRRSSPLRD